MLTAQEVLLRARKNVFTNRASEALSKMRGDGLDFCEIRPYQAGDDVRKINFPASAKSGELQTNIFNENKQIRTIIAVVFSSSLFFGSKKLKIETLAEIVATLGYSALQQKNHSEIVLFNGTRKEVFHLRSEGDLLRVLEIILTTHLLNITEDFDTIREYFLQHNKALGFVVSDFYHHHEYGILAHKHQLHAIIVRDTLEEFPYFGEELSLINLQNSHNIDINSSKKISKKYQNTLIKHDNTIFTYLRKHHIIFGKVFTCDDVFLRLQNILR